MSTPALGPVAVVPHSQEIENAVRWLVSMRREDWPSPIVPHLQRRFGLSAKDACATLREFNIVMGRAQ